GPEKRVALDAVVGLDREQPELALAAEAAGVAAVSGRWNIGPGEQRKRDVRDLHATAPPFVSVPSLSSRASHRAVKCGHSALAPRSATERPSSAAQSPSPPNSARQDQRRRVANCSACS